MGGIVGCFRRDGRSPERSALVRQTELLADRGPDEGAVFVDDPFALGHRRLDVEGRGQQPRWDGEGRVGVVVDADLENADELSARLRDRGHPWGSDPAAVILAAYREWGDGFAEKLQGRFAVALVDRRAKRLVLARDPLGGKPLYFHVDAQRVVFASEVRALLVDPGVPRILDPAAAAAWFHWGYVPTPSTLVRGVRAVSPGEVLLVEAERLRARRFWTPGTVVAGPGATAALRARLEAAASGGSDRAVVALSGGRVSSSLAAWRRNLRGAALTYSRPGLDARDRQESLRMVDEHDLSHQEAPVEGSPAVRVQAALDAMDVPLGDPSFVGDVWWAAGLERIVPHAAPVLVGHGGAALVEAPVTERIPQELFPSWVTHNETLKTPSRLQRLEAELHRVDRLATASRRVLRAPFARTELLEAADGLSDPVDWHRLARGSVPARVARRSGSRYAPPLDAWMRGPLNRWIEGLFFGGLSASGLLEAGRLRWVWYQHQLRIRDYGASLWRLAVIEHWCRSAFSGEEIRVERRRRRGTSFFA